MTMTIDFPTLQMWGLWGRHLVRGQAIALLQYWPKRDGDQTQSVPQSVQKVALIYFLC